MTGITNFLLFIYQNYVSILVCVGLIIGIARKVKTYFANNKDEQIAIAKNQIKSVMLELITNAEIEYEDWNKSGEIKRSQVIEQIYDMYPILSKVVDQEAVIEFIDNQIDESLKTLRQIIKEQEKVNA